jgi:hypothetical protein
MYNSPINHFKVGDLVKVHKGTTDSSRILDGMLGRIIEAYKFHCVLDIELTIRKFAGGVYWSELELVPEAEWDN